ncbi:MAG: response regulator, partial [Bacteroidetes bacterium]|nr:response regulator [Bacteroidota bacterium]
MRRKCKILIIDDDPLNLDSLEKLLGSFQIEIVRALSGEDALVKTLDHTFSLALIDVQMPYMDGYDTVKLLRELHHTRSIPVIFISEAFDEKHLISESIESGVVDFVTRPVNPLILTGKVKMFLELHAQKQKLVEEIDQRRKSEQVLLSKERELNEAIKKAELADKLKSAFLANISHEIRTPMNSIIGFSNLLKDPQVEYEDRVKYIQYINNSGELLLNLINDVIDFAKIEADQIKINKEEVKVPEVLMEMVDTYSEELKRRNKRDVSLILNIAEDQNEMIIYTDYFRFRQIISNLIMNAIKFTSKGYIQLGFTSVGENIKFF